MQSQYEAMRKEMAFYADLFNKLADQCFKKCIPRFHDAELNTGESVCVDRCTAKYIEATNKVGEVMQKTEAAMKELAEQQMKAAAN